MVASHHTHVVTVLQEEEREAVAELLRTYKPVVLLLIKLTSSLEFLENV